MATLHEKVILALASHFRDLADSLDDVPGTGRITGAVVSPEFRNLDYQQRQERLSSALCSALTPEELLRVGPIVALTPEEAHIDISTD